MSPESRKVPPQRYRLGDTSELAQHDPPMVIKTRCQYLPALNYDGSHLEIHLGLLSGLDARGEEELSHGKVIQCQA